jgi:hypothetical protein
LHIVRSFDQCDADEFGALARAALLASLGRWMRRACPSSVHGSLPTPIKLSRKFLEDCCAAPRFDIALSTEIKP